MTAKCFPVKPHTSQADLFVAYNLDESEAMHMRMVVPITDPVVGAFTAPMFQIVWCAKHPDGGDELSTPARPA